MPTTSTDPRTAAAALLVPGTTCHGFAVERCETVPELDSDAYVLRHTVSGARLLYLACDDENKAFAIGFKTPPADSTGVFHILEHSVLCGSAKFPVKEPFVDLIKSSMQTFLNAMTYPDKTIYPVATTNEQDLYNLMDVYLDAVFNPAIYTKPTIFEQEGWHYELDLPEGAEGEGDGNPASLREGTLRYNGVVFNEMKGALSDPMSVLDDAVNAALYPDTAYAHESGGDPRAIPALTYEQFLDTHARHYNPSNSYITLYGDLDVDRALAFLDERYLSQPSAASRRMDAAVAAGEDPSTLAPNPLDAQAPVTCEYKRVEMATTPENALVGLGLVLGSALDRKRTIAADILFEALLGSNEAPVKKAILAAGLGGNVVSYTAAECLQPYELIMLQNAQPGVARELRRVFQDACRDLCEHGVPRERLEAIISSNEYDLRQRDYGIADGVAIACDALSTWLYDDDAATLALKYGPVYEELRGELDGSYFEDLLRELVLENDHMALVELVPVDAGAGSEGAEAAELAAKRDAMTDAELDEKLPRISVYARVSPEHKIRIVDAWQRQGRIVSMTGDGVNDAPALKKADIGVAMGITGTEVSKDAASMILTDDNFATIVKAVINGRNIYANIKNAIQFLLSGNTAGILCVLYASLMALPVPFAPVHLLFINLLTDSLPAIAIGMEPSRRGLLNQPPRNPKEPILNGSLLRRIVSQGLLIAVATMAAFYLGHQSGNAMLASTMAFATLTLARLFHGFNCRGDESIFRLKFGTNKYSLMAFFGGILLLAAVLFIPGLNTLFLVAPLTMAQIGQIGLLAFLPTLIIQIVKMITDRQHDSAVTGKASLSDD